MIDGGIYTGPDGHPIHGSGREVASAGRSFPTFDELGSDLSNSVYKASVRIFETAENARLIHGNGHHMAQELVRYAVYMLLRARIPK